jgi:cysteine synthase
MREGRLLALMALLLATCVVAEPASSNHEGRFLRRAYPGIRVHPVEPAESPTLTTGHKMGNHRIQGISDEFIPSIVKLDELDAIISVADGDAILMAQRLARSLGLGVGISSGANFLAAIRALEHIPNASAAVTVFCDDNKKYLSTDLMATEPVRPGYWTPEIELEDYLPLPQCQRPC